MNFFEHQDEARKKTGRLVLLFGAAVIAIIVAVYFVFAVLFASQSAPEGTPFAPRDLWNPQLFLLTAVGVGLVIAAGSFYRTATLAAGGKSIAEMLGGRLVASATTDWRERRLLNVIEEMALAAGMPVPPVYVMDHETAINAFAAGFTPADAVVGVTRGAIESLDRDELQGVIAHEFSHILNGDMRLNIRLIGVLHGILLLSLIGFVLFRMALHVRPSRSSSSDKNNGGAAGIMLAMIAIGGALYVLGYIGVFFGHLIKSAVSRQREYLADASAVQFTRHPAGIAGALKKIGGIGSRLKSDHAEQASHMFFGNGVKATWLNLTATHPPLQDRIRRVDPSFDGDFSVVNMASVSGADVSSLHATPALDRAQLTAAAGVSSLSAQQAVADVGAPQPSHLEFASALLAAMPAELSTELHDPLGAAALLYALLLHADPAEDEPELYRLASSTSPAAADRVRRALRMLANLPPEGRLPLAQLTLTALRQLTPSQFEEFRRAVVALIRADRRVSLFEYGIHRMIVTRLSEYFGDARPRIVQFETLGEVTGAATVLLSAVAHAGHPRNPAAAGAAFGAGRSLLGVSASQPLSVDACGLTALDEALDRLGVASGGVKQKVLEACAASIAHDGKMTLDEGELLRTISDALDCPMPPPVARTFDD